MTGHCRPMMSIFYLEMHPMFEVTGFVGCRIQPVPQKIVRSPRGRNYG